MCVRYTLHAPQAALEAVSEALGVRLDPRDWMAPRYNVALTQTVPVVASAGGRPELVAMRWGLVPPDDRGKAQRRLLPNARAETLARLPAFRDAAAGRRCLVPANGFYEFKDAGGRKDAYLFGLADGRAFAFAGLWEPPLDDLPSFTIVTTEPNADVAPIHDRMPVILTRETLARWIGGQPLGKAALQELTRPLAAGALAARRVSRSVNSVRNEGPQCHAPPEEDPPELF